ncbi:MAG: hypothetical protein RLZZ292_1316 [Bacteroidota bacterium]|jgi:hypothetical protein
MPKKADLQYLAHLRIKEAKILWRKYGYNNIGRKN